MSRVDEAIVVGKLDKGFWPERLDGVDFGQDLGHRLHLVAGSQQYGTGAKLTSMRAASAGLDGEAIVFGWVEQIEAWQGRFPQIKGPGALLTVEGFETASLKVQHYFRPKGFTFPDH